jgi:Asp-tRNA(Asn)/Glu-tRNA(Gln) amidotransferase A subunit family amidase
MQAIDSWWSDLFIANLNGNPAISILCVTDTSGLPVGLHATARWDHENILIDMASTMNTFVQWTDCKFS